MHLICTNEDENEYSHGSIITKQFEIDSYYDLDSYEVAISTYNGVDITKKTIIAFNAKNVPIIEIEFIVLDTCEIGEICLVLQPLSSSDNAITDASTVRYYYVETEQTSTPSTGPYRSILKQV